MLSTLGLAYTTTEHTNTMIDTMLKEADFVQTGTSKLKLSSYDGNLYIVCEGASSVNMTYFVVHHDGISKMTA